MDCIFVVGDIVTRIGTDEQEVLQVNDGGDLILVRCIKEPHNGFCNVGDEEWNIPWRYDLVRRPVDTQHKQGGRVMADSKITIAVETIINNAMIEIVQHFADNDGICIKSMHVDWLDISSLCGNSSKVMEITIEATHRPNLGEVQHDDDNG